MVDYSQLTERCQKIADQVKRSLTNPPGTPPEVILVQIGAGEEKDRLTAYIAQLMHNERKRVAYVTADDAGVDHLLYNILRKT